MIPSHGVIVIIFCCRAGSAKMGRKGPCFSTRSIILGLYTFYYIKKYDCWPCVKRFFTIHRKWPKGKVCKSLKKCEIITVNPRKLVYYIRYAERIWTGGLTMTEKTYAVTGMTCAACSAAVKKAVTKLDGVENSDINLATEKLNVTFDENQLSDEDLKKAVEDAGYGLRDENPPKTAELSIEGMTCAACSAAVERVTKKLDGVKSAQVNLTTNKWRI